MSFSIAELFSSHFDEKFDLHEHHLNNQLVRVLRTIGYDRVNRSGARELFIRCVLVEGEWTTHQKFFLTHTLKHYIEFYLKQLY
jgi:hypothetical protein